MIKALVSDLSRVLLLPKDKSYLGTLNGLHRELSQNPDYKLFNYFELNNELLEFYKSLKGKIVLYMFTSETIQDSPELEPYLKPVFNKIYSALKMGIGKEESLAYKTIASDMRLQPEEILYIDDSMANIGPALTVGLQAILYKDNESIISEIKSKLEK